MMSRCHLFALLLLAVFCSPSTAQTLDPDFHSPIVIKGAIITDLIIQPDDKVLVSGTININDVEKANTLVRLNHDGSIDQTFSLGVDMAYGIGTIRLQNNGDILFATSEKRIGRLSSTGELLALVTVSEAVNDICVQPDSKILVAGGSKLMRYNEDLTVDNTFTPVSANASITKVKLQNTAIIIGGRFTEVNSVTKNYLARITDTGTLDLSFDTGTGSNEIQNFSIQSDGKILLTNSFINSFNGVQAHGLFRLNEDGSADSGFTPPSLNGGTSEAIFQDGKIIIAAFITLNGTTKDRIFRLEYNGAIDQTFTPIELETFASFNLSFALASDQNFITNHGHNLGNHHGLVKFTTNGIPDNSFQPELTSYGDVLTGDFQNEKLVIGGEFIKVNGFSTYNVAVLNSDGSVDETFHYNQYETSIQQVKILNDQNILITGKDLVKLSQQGQVIPEFDFQPFNRLRNVWKFVALENNKILAGGPNNPPNLLNADGSRDFSFDFPIDALCCSGSTAFDFDRQSTGKVLFGSVFSAFGGTSVNRLLRLNTDGSLDPTFNTGTGPDKTNPGTGFIAINMVKTLSTDQLIVGGYFDLFDGFACNGLVKLSPDGTLDQTFTANVIYDLHFPQLVREFDDKLLVIENSYDLTGPITLLKPRNQDGTMNQAFDLPPELSLKAVEDIDTVGRRSLFLFGEMKLSGNPLPAFVVKLTDDNIPPVITATSLTTIAEDSPLQIDLSDFTVVDDHSADVLELSFMEGAHYTIHENTLTPEPDYSGDITVHARVNDGDKSSPAYEFHITVTPVNDQPEIINVHQGLVATKGVPLQIELDDIEVLDPDNTYPAGFTLTLLEGDNYSVISNSIICHSASVETIQVTVKVNDGTIDSDLFSFPIAVNVVTGIEQGTSDELVIYPNPIKQIAEFRYKGEEPILHITLLDVSGQEILKSTFSDVAVGQMDVSKLPPGLYIARVATGKKVITRKIQKTF